MNPSTRWKQAKKRVRKLNPGKLRKELRTRARVLGGKPARQFADISNNNGLSPHQIHLYAEDHDVIVIKASEGQTWRDPELAKMVKAAKDAGLIVAPYHYARPDNGNAPWEEARNFVHTCRAAGLRLGPRRKLWYQRDELPGVLDYEEHHPTGRDAAWIREFMREYRTLTRHGVAKWKGSVDDVTQDCILYGGSVVREQLQGSKIRALYWLAAYTQTAAPYWPGGVARKHRLAWQFTDKGRFKAFGSKDTDRNRFVGNLKLRDIIQLAI